MIAIGGSIGTGLFIGSGTALSTGGPASLLVSYVLIGAVLFCTVQALGEMAVTFPVAGSFSAFTTVSLLHLAARSHVDVWYSALSILLLVLLQDGIMLCSGPSLCLWRLLQLQVSGYLFSIGLRLCYFPSIN